MYIYAASFGSIMFGHDNLVDRNCAKCPECCIDYESWLRFQNGLYRIVRDPLFELLITLCIILNTMFLAVEHHGMSQSMRDVLDYGNKMVCVRKELTQLLMRVTSEEIEKCAREVFSMFPGLKAQHQTQQRPRQSQSEKGNLGLGIYDDSDTESSASEEEAEAEPSQQLQSAYETEDALRDKLNQRKREFSRVEREIELKIQAQEEHERLVAQKEDSDDSEDDDDDDKPGQVHRAQPGKLCPANITL
ncbi:uncharacterized protein LOC103524127 [Diaphorina citri]|uniref:Uncharacterized protein LOC103524127 n=1 Tax=Diaphorina citri TaxID=121845 RepID=A0A1S3DT15_DIACI|nr:uncharacterized protein LOC103524127 [Diaphorina citri]